MWYYSNKLPDYKFLKNYKPPVSSKLYSDDGELVIDFSTEKRIFVPYNSIPKKIINSFLSASTVTPQILTVNQANRQHLHSPPK